MVLGDVVDSSQRVRAILSFVQVADAGSFAAAARVLGISSAAVSKNVAGLEQALGVRLMNRTTRTLSLQARVALQALDSAVDTVAAQRADTSGRVRISTSAAFGRQQLMPALPSLQERHPGLCIEVDFDDRVVDLVRDGYDLAIRGGNIVDSALVSRPICRLNVVLVASPHYLAARGIPRSPDDLARHRLIARRFLAGKVSPWMFRAGHGSRTMLDPTATAVLTLSAPETVAEAACAGMGVAQVGVHHAWSYLVGGALKLVLHDWHDPGSCEMVMQYPHRALMAPRVRVTLEHLLGTFARDESLHVPLESLEAHVA